MSEILVPEGWQSKKVGDCIQILTDYTANGSFATLKENVTYYNEPNYACLVRTTDLDKKIFNPERFTDKKGYEFLRKSSLFEGDIVIANVGSTGKAYRIPKYHLPMTLAPNMYLVRFQNDLMDDKFAYYVITDDGFQRRMHQNIASTTLRAINKSNFKDVQFLHPPLPEQQKIASILTLIDDVIEKTQSQLNKLQNLKKGMMNELLTYGIAHSEFNDSPVGMIPRKWKVVELKELLSFISYGFTNPMSESTSGPLMITAKDVVGGRIAVETARRTTQEDFNNLLTDKSKPKIGDILLTKDGTLGRVAIVDIEGACINQSVAVLRPNNEVVTDFLFQLLSSPIYQKEMLDKAGGSTIKHIYITVVDKMKVVCPPLNEQRKIASILSSIDKTIEEKQRKLEQTKSLKKSLMQDLLTGKIRVSI